MAGVVLCGLALRFDASGGHICAAKDICPLSWDGDTAHVPDSVVMVTGFQHCAPDSFREGPTQNVKDTISVFFVIDHSGSMSYMDSNATRYRVVEDFIDSLHAKSPGSEVGIAVFSNRLLHSHEDDPFFEQLDAGSGWPDSYVPLTRLDETVDGMSAVEKLKWSIELAASPNDTDIGGNLRLVNGDYGLTGRHDSRLPGNPETGYNGTTDITLGFDAARKAFGSALYPAGRQFIIFLSDGVPQRVDVEREPYMHDYVDGENVPTTFTAYFINPTQPIPPEIKDMTANIRVNGYSSTNERSDVWKTSGTETDLVGKLLTEYIGVGQKIFKSTPTKLTINGIATTTFDGELAVFDSPFLLDGEYKTFQGSLEFFREAPLNKAETRQFSFVLRRTDDAEAIAADNISIECWEQGVLELLYEDTPVDVVESDYYELQVRFYPSAQFPIDNVTLEVTNASGSDTLILTTANYGTYFGVRFEREFGSPSIDDVLQNGMNDSIIVTYRNPGIPLDVVRLSRRVLPPRDLEVKKAYYLDQAGGANGYPDVIRVEIGDTLFPDEVDLIKSYIQLQTDRSITVKNVLPSSQGFDIILTEPKPTTDEPFTGLLRNERLYIDKVADLSGGGAFPLTDVAIHDSMAPVIVGASYFDIADPAARDTLVVSFSEPVKTIGAPEPFLLRSAASGAEFRLRLSHITTEGATVTFAVVPMTGQIDVRMGDSIWINPAANVADTLGIRQLNADNAHRELDYRRLHRILSAAYFDTSTVPDGRIDLVRVVMDRPPDAALLEALAGTIELPAFRELSFTAGDMHITSEGFHVYVSQPSGMAPFTGIDPDRDKLVASKTESTTRGFVPVTSVPIADSLAPVLTAATYKPAIVTEEGQRPPDTLTVHFSEPTAPIKDPYPFVFVDADGEEYTVRLSPLRESEGGLTHTFIVDSVEGGRSPKSSDSLWINPAAGIADKKAGNVQDRRSRPVGLSVRAYRYSYVMHAWPNPGDPASAKVPDAIRSMGVRRTHGIIVVARPLGPVAEHVRLTGRMTVYDDVGNIVCRGVKGVVGDEKDQVAFVWDGTNGTGRRVGTGTYLAVVEITDSQDITEHGSVRIGVRR